MCAVLLASSVFALAGNRDSEQPQSEHRQRHEQGTNYCGVKLAPTLSSTNLIRYGIGSPMGVAMKVLPTSHATLNRYAENVAFDTVVKKPAVCVGKSVVSPPILPIAGRTGAP